MSDRTMSNGKAEYKELPIHLLKPGRYQPRLEFPQQYLQELAISIKSVGILQPLVVRSLADHEYEIIAGECRWRAAQIAGLTTLPCMIKNISDAEAAAATTIENLQRQDLNPIEEAQAYQKLVDEFDYQ